MIVAIHQPNFLPHFGYFAKIAAAGRFILFDTAQYTRESYINRVRMLLPCAPGVEGALAGTDGRHYAAQWCTVPVPKSMPLRTPISDVTVSGVPRWSEKLLRRLDQAYRGTEGFRELWPVVSEAITAATAGSSLVDLNESLLQGVMGVMGIHTEVVRASKLDMDDEPRSPSHRLAALTLAAGGNCYLSGPSGHKYLDKSAFREMRVELRFVEPVAMAYEQPVAQFVQGLSVADMIFRAGARRCKAHFAGR